MRDPLLDASPQAVIIRGQRATGGPDARDHLFDFSTLFHFHQMPPGRLPAATHSLLQVRSLFTSLECYTGTGQRTSSAEHPKLLLSDL